MSHPWRFNKRIIMRKDNDVKQSSSKPVAFSQMQTYALKSGHAPKSIQIPKSSSTAKLRHASIPRHSPKAIEAPKSHHTPRVNHAPKSRFEVKSNHHEIKKNYCVQPKGIIFNYNIKKRSTTTTNDNSIKVNKNHRLTTVEESNTKEHINDVNDDSPSIDDSNIQPNKMYKIVVVDGKIMLAEHSADDIEEHVVENVDNNDSDVEFVDTDHIESESVNKNSNFEKCDATKEVTSFKVSSSEVKINLTPTKQIMNANQQDYCKDPVSKNSLEKYEAVNEIASFKVTSSENKMNLAPAKQIMNANHHNYSKSPKILNEDARSGPAKTYSRTNFNEPFMKKLASGNGLCLPNSNMFTTKKDLEDARRGKAMVLLPLQKYTSLKKKLTDMQKEKEDKEAEVMRNIVKKNTIGVQTGKCHENELNELAILKNRLSQTFTEAQIDMICHSKRLKDIEWSDSEMEKVLFLKQIISKPAYEFLKSKMRFPLPTLYAVRQWMIERNIYVRPNKKEKNQKPKQNTPNVVAEEENLDTTTSAPEEPDRSIVYDESLSTQNIKDQSVTSETAQAVNTILEEPQNIEFGSSVQVHHTLSIPTDAGEQLVYYTYDNVNNENDANTTNYMPDDNVTSVEEIVQSEVIKPRRRPMAEAQLRCRLCMRPFDTDQEVREHVPLHYHNTYYTNYLDATKPFVCEFCNEPLRHRFDLVHHHRAHLGINSLKCWFPGCTYEGKNRDNLKSHHDCHKSASFKCEECGALFKTHKYMRQHRERRHAARALLHCHLCRATCLTLYTYRKHMNSHNRPPRIKCVQEGCGETFYSRSSMRRHVSALHVSAARPYKCTLCPHAAYAREGQLNKHLHKHETHKISHCMKCLKVFYDYGEFYTHCMEHKLSEPKCKCDCGDRFVTKKKLREHKLQCTFVSPDNNESTKPKRKRKNRENNPSADQTKRRRTKEIQQNNGNKDIVTEGLENKEQVKVNQSLEQVQQLDFAAGETTEDITEKVITLQLKNKHGIIKLAKNQTTDSHLEKFIVIPKHHQQDLPILGNHQQYVVANSSNEQQIGLPAPDDRLREVIVMPNNNQQDVNATSENVSQNVILVPDNNFQKVFIVPNDQEGNIITQGYDVTPSDNQQNTFKVSSEQGHVKQIISVTKGHCPKKLTPIPKGSQLEKIISMSTVDKIVSRPGGNYVKKVLTLSADSPLKKVIKDPVLPVTKEISDLESPLRNATTILESPVNKVIAGPEKPPSGAITVPENQKVIAIPEIKLKNVVTDSEIPLKKDPGHGGLIRKITAVPVMQNQNAQIDISTPKDRQIKKVIKITKPIIKVDGTLAPEMKNLKKVVVQIPGTKKLQMVKGITREQLIAALATKQKKLVQTTTTNNNSRTPLDIMQKNNAEVVEMQHSQQEISVQESTVTPDEPILGVQG